MDGLSVRRSEDGWSITRFFQTPKMSSFLYENLRGCPTLTLLNALGVLGVLNVLNVLNVLHVLDMPMDASLALWALLLSFFIYSFTHSFGRRK